MMLPVHVPRKTIAAAIRADRDQTNRPMKPISRKALRMIDASAKNLKKGKASEPITVTGRFKLTHLGSLQIDPPWRQVVYRFSGSIFKRRFLKSERVRKDREYQNFSTKNSS